MFSGWIYHPDEETGAESDRLAIENSDYNGYGFTVGHRNDKVWIERRVDGKSKPIKDAIVDVAAPKDQWFRFEFFVESDGYLRLALYDSSGQRIGDVAAQGAAEYSEFDRVTIHGGYPYYVDELKIDLL